jgi:hypothetical protein
VSGPGPIVFSNSGSGCQRRQSRLQELKGDFVQGLSWVQKLARESSPRTDIVLLIDLVRKMPAAGQFELRKLQLK